MQGARSYLRGGHAHEKKRKKAALVLKILRKTDKNIEQHQVDAGHSHADTTQA